MSAWTDILPAKSGYDSENKNLWINQVRLEKEDFN